MSLKERRDGNRKWERKRERKKEILTSSRKSEVSELSENLFWRTVENIKKWTERRMEDERKWNLETCDKRNYENVAQSERSLINYSLKR